MPAALLSERSQKVLKVLEVMLLLDVYNYRNIHQCEARHVNPCLADIFLF